MNYTAPGDCVIDANQAGNSEYAAAPEVQRTIVVTVATVPGSDCSAAVKGIALGTVGWAATTNTTASGLDVPANAIDGDLVTRFSSDEDQAAGDYLEVNMGSAQSFDELEMEVPNSPADYAVDYGVGVSSDGTSWTTVANCTGTGTPEIVSFPVQTARYVEVVLSAASDNWWSIDEFRLYTVSPKPPASVPGSDCSAVVRGAALGTTGWVASTNTRAKGQDAPANAIDGDLVTRFSSDEDQAAGEYFKVRLGSAERFDELEMEVPHYPADYARGYSVGVSSDGTSWTTVANCTGTRTPEVVSFRAKTAGYVEVILTAASGNWWSIDEFRLYGASPAKPSPGKPSPGKPSPGKPSPGKPRPGKTGQTIILAGLPDTTLAESPVTVRATASSGLKVTVTTTTPSVCRPGGANGATIRLVGPGRAPSGPAKPATPLTKPLLQLAELRGVEGQSDDRLRSTGQRGAPSIRGDGARNCIVGPERDRGHDDDLGVPLRGPTAPRSPCSGRGPAPPGPARAATPPIARPSR